MTHDIEYDGHVTADELRAYLGGWVDEDSSAQIERHLARCEACEDTLIALEAEPDTLVRQLRGAPSSGEYVLQQALANSRELVGGTGDTTATAPLDRLGPYQILRQIGSGGMGAVYLARHEQLGKDVAIKLVPVPRCVDDQALKRFAREVRAAGGLDHPSIVTATDAGRHDRWHYLVMEYIDGPDLSQTCRHLGRLEIPDACEIIRVTAVGLAYAHGEGIVHRDIKPSNLMLGRSGDVKILDFGLARLTKWDDESAELTTVGQLMGTLDYMAPEQAERPETVDFRADLYSLGATLFRLLCGRPPLVAAPNLSPLAKLRLLSDHQPPRADTLRDDLPEGLVECIRNLLRTDPADRPASASHVAEALQPFCHGHDLATLASNVVRTAKGHSQGLPRETMDHQLPDPPPVAHQARHFGGRRMRWLALALLPLLTIAGIVITLQTKKGKLVIESETGDVTVRLLKNGQTYDEVKIQPGQTITKLYAGEYEVELSEESDGFALSDDHITITRGEQSGAQIISVATPESGERSGANQASQEVVIEENAEGSRTDDEQDAEPLYKNRPLAEWLDQLERERSLEGIRDALGAVRWLADENNSSQISQTLLDVGPRLVRNFHREIAPSLFRQLRRVNDPENYVRILVNGLEGDDEIWSGSILDSGLVHATSKIDPIVEWLIANVLSNLAQEAPPTAVHEFALRSMADDQVSDSAKEQLHQAMLGSSWVSDEVWFDDRALDSEDDRIRQVVAAQAYNAIMSDSASPKQLSLGCMILQTMVDATDKVAVTGQDGPTRSDLIEGLLARIGKLPMSPDSIVRFHGSRFRDLSFPLNEGTVGQEVWTGFASNNVIEFELGFTYHSGGKVIYASPLLECLDLLIALDAKPLDDPRLWSLAKRSQESLEVLQNYLVELASLQSFKARTQSTKTEVSFMWPSLNIAGQNHKWPTPDQWFELLAGRRVRFLLGEQLWQLPDTQP